MVFCVINSVRKCFTPADVVVSIEWCHSGRVQSSKAMRSQSDSARMDGRTDGRTSVTNSAAPTLQIHQPVAACRLVDRSILATQHSSASSATLSILAPADCAVTCRRQLQTFLYRSTFSDQPLTRLSHGPALAVCN